MEEPVVAGLRKLECESDAAYVWLPEIVDRFARFSSPNVVACSLRLVNKATAAQFSSFTTCRLSLYSPNYAFVERWGSLRALQACSFKERRQLLTLTAASGNISNIKTALIATAGTLTSEAPTRGDVASCLCAWLHARGCFWIDDLLASAAEAGQDGMCDWLLTSGCTLRTSTIRCAARGGHVERLLERLSPRCPRLHPPCTRPADGAPPWAHDGGVPDVAGLAQDVAEGCDLASMQRLFRRWGLAAPPPAPANSPRPEPPRPPAAQPQATPQPHRQPQLLPALAAREADVVAAASASLTPDWRAKVEWLEDLLNCAPIPESQPGSGPGSGPGPLLAPVPVATSSSPSVGSGAAVVVARAAAARRGARERLLWLQSRGYLATAAAVSAGVVGAAGAGNTAALAFLLGLAAKVKVGAGARPANADAAMAAARSGHLAALQALLQAAGAGSVEPLAAARAAAGGGHLAVVVWLAEVFGLGAEELGEDVAFYAAQSGALGLLQWLHQERGCGLRGRLLLEAAARGGCAEMLEWLVERGCEVEEDERPYEAAARNGDVATLRCLHRLGVPQRETDLPQEEALRKGHSFVLTCLQEMGCGKVAGQRGA